MKKIRLIPLLAFLFFQLSAQIPEAELISQRTLTSIKYGKLTRSSHFEILINNKAGEKYTHISIPYSKMVKVSDVRAVIKDQQGHILKKLKKSDISNRSNISNSSLYEDDYVLKFTLRHHQYPYIIEYSYEERADEFLYVEYWVPFLDPKIPVRHADLTVTVPDDYNIAIDTQMVSCLPVVHSEGNRVFHWEAEYSGPLPREAGAPPDQNYLPAVKVVPLDFKYDSQGSFAAWKDYGDWQERQLMELMELPGDEKGRIQQLVSGLSSDKEKIRKLYHYLQDETRYINISIETGGMIPYPASYVAHNKYGDCKALTNYFRAVLEYAGIPSYYCLVRSGGRIREIDTSFPSQQFNHVILYIPMEEEPIWLDCTSKAAYGYLGTFSQNRNALVIEQGCSHFLRTPALDHEDVLVSRKFDITYHPGNVSEVSNRSMFRGKMYEQVIGLKDAFNEADKARIVRNSIVEDGFELSDFQIIQEDRDSASIQLSYSAQASNIYTKYGNELLINNIPLSIPDLEEPGNRKLPVQIDYPIHQIDTLIYEVPDYYRSGVEMADDSLVNAYGSYALHFYPTENYIQIVKHLLIHEGIIPLSDFQEFYTFLEGIRRLENSANILLISSEKK